MKNLNLKFHNLDINRVKLMALSPVKTGLKLSVSMLIKMIKPQIIILKSENLLLHIKIPFSRKNKTVKDVESTPSYKIVTIFPLWKESTKNNSLQFSNMQLLKMNRMKEEFLEKT